MRVVETAADLSAVRTALGTGFGFVPTMGYLHEGHLSLVRRARAECGAVLVSIFVNPTQFGPNEDLSRYPRDRDRDLALLAEAGCDAVWLPEVETLYPAGFATTIEVGALGTRFEGAIRPGHFNGVATVVQKLERLVTPRRMYFGQKDAQQCAVIAQVARDLNWAAEIVVCPTRRDADGLALSSRNVYLDARMRASATAIPRALARGQALFASGTQERSALSAAMEETLHAAGLLVDYVEIVDPATFLPVEQATALSRVLIAARAGTTRLLDNALLGDAPVTEA